jgi:hypothetical protein
MKTVLSIAALAYALACAPKTTTRSAPAAAPEPAERVVAEGEYGQIVQLAVGQQLRVAAPRGIAGWQVGYDNALLELLTPPAKVRAPGPEGWLFRARGAGEGEIVLTSIAAPGGGPAVLRLALRFKTAP